MGGGAPDWNTVVEAAASTASARARLLTSLSPIGPPGTMAPAIPANVVRSAAFGRVLEACPCLYSQVDVTVSARGVVHLCEVTLKVQITSSNVNDAFLVQHPNAATPPFIYPPRVSGASGGDIMEALCSEVLTNHGVPRMLPDASGDAVWTTKSHLPLNSGSLLRLKLYGDFLIPAAPHNILVSVKSEAARERFVVSGNRLECVGFGFFNDASEFWSVNRMNLLKRWGFVAIYMPQATFDALQAELTSRGQLNFAINVSGRSLFRPLAEFGPDMARIAGQVSFDL